MRGCWCARRACALVLLFAVCVAGCRAERQTSPDTITIAVFSSPNSFDPRVGTDEVSQKVYQLLYDNLITLDDQLRPAPGLATHWEQPDDTTLLVHLRTGVRFHDGRTLTADDVAYTFNSIIDPAFVSARRGAYAALARVDVVDSDTARFVLKEPSGSFVIQLVMPIVPRGSGAELRTQPIGTGPYRFVSYSVDDALVLAAFGHYHGGAPQNEGLVLKIVPDEMMRGLELRQGAVDLIVNDINPDTVEQFREDGTMQIVSGDGTDYAYIAINLRDGTLADRRVRHAIGYAVNRQAIVDHLRRGLATTAITLVPPASWAFTPDAFQFTYDPSRAQALLEEAGHRDPDGDGPLPRLRLSLKVSTNEFSRLQGAVLQQDLRAAGIELDVRSYEFATLAKDVATGNFQLAALQWVGISDPDMLRRVFHSTQVPPSGFNRGYYRNAEVDALIDRASAAQGEDDRRRWYREVQMRVAEDAPYISLWYKINVAVAQRDLTGLRLGPLASFAFLKDVHRPSTRPAAR